MPYTFAGLIIGLLIINLTAIGQVQKDVHSREQLWLGYFNQTRITDRFGLWLDMHYRITDNFAERPFQFLVRPALIFYVKDNVRLQAGYAFINNFPAKGFHTSRPEHRGWQQIWRSQKYTGFQTLQWLRVEERFNKKIVNDALQPETYYTVRLRYKLWL